MRANRVRHRYKVANPSPSPSPEAMGNDVGDLATDVVILKNEFVGLKSDLASLATAFQLFSDEYRKGKQWNWTLLTPLFAVGTVMLALLGLMIQNQISPLASDMKSIANTISVIGERVKEDEIHARDQDLAISRSAEKDTRSEADRADLRADMTNLRTTANENSASIKSLRSVVEKALTEVETQVAAVEQMRNKMVGELDWKLAVLWPLVMHQPYPIINPPTPTIALRPTMQAPP